MSKRKEIISAALVTGLAATSVDAAQSTQTDYSDSDDVVQSVAEQIVIYGGDVEDDLITVLETDLEQDLIGVEAADLDDEDWFQLAQTIYAGPGTDDLRRPRKGGNITLDNGIKKGSNITLDNGIKRPGAVKLESAPKRDRKRIRRGARKRK